MKFERFKECNYSNGKFLSDKSYAFDTVYFLSRFILDFSKENSFSFSENADLIKEYISNIFGIFDTGTIRNYYSEYFSLLKYAGVISEEDKKEYVIHDMTSLLFIAERMENAYIFIYILCFYTFKNAQLLPLYQNYCFSTTNDEKTKILKEMQNRMAVLNGSIKNKEENAQWLSQNLKYVVNNLNYANKQNRISRTMVIKEPYSVEMISVNIEGTKSRTKKINGYLKCFNREYVINCLNNYLIVKEN